jgi:hypothetical protein
MKVLEHLAGLLVGVLTWFILLIAALVSLGSIKKYVASKNM